MGAKKKALGAFFQPEPFCWDPFARSLAFSASYYQAVLELGPRQKEAGFQLLINSI